MVVMVVVVMVVVVVVVMMVVVVMAIAVMTVMPGVCKKLRITGEIQRYALFYFAEIDL